MNILYVARRIALVGLLIAGVHQARAFSLAGPFSTWQTVDIGYQLGADIEGPMYLGEEFRWNVPTIYYGYDPSFLDYFGQDGVNAIEKAIAMLNRLPAMSKITVSDLNNPTKYPLDTRHYNYQASALGLRDLGSFALAEVLNQLGLAGPERWAWTLRSRIVINNIPFYTTIRMNYDPITLAPTSYINGTLYTYTILQTRANPDTWEAVELATDPLAPTVTTVAALNELEGTFDLRGQLAVASPGMYYSGLTRDDVASLRYIYSKGNQNVENLPTNAVSGPGGGPWGPPPGTNIVNTNFVVTALRPGIDKVNFVRLNWNSLLGQFSPYTNNYTDTFITNGVARQQGVQRVLGAPDIVFAAADIGVNQNGIPLIIGRNSGWVSNDGINGSSALTGPGQVNSGIIISFSKVGLYFRNVPEGSEADATPGFTWGSFDGSTNAPIVYPVGSSIYDLERQVMSDSGSPWGPP